MEVKNVPVIHNKPTWEAINSFPIKSKDMTVRQLRQLCVDFFRFNKTVCWTPDADLTFIRSSKTMQEDTMTKGTLYSGYPYAMGTGNCYRLMDYLDEKTGVVDIRAAAKCFRLFASQCSIGAYWGWGRVIRSANYDWTQNMTHANGFLRLGPYTYDDSVRDLAKGHNTVAICEENGEQTMYQSYAQLKLADGLVYYTTAGHVVMASCDAHVEYKENGDIDGENSFITIIDQTNKWTEYENDAGDKAVMKANVDIKWNFKYLFEKHYLPFTFPEFLGTYPIEDTVCTFSHEENTITKQQLFSAVITSNYGIADAYAIVTDPEGKQVYKHAVRAIKAGTKEMAFVEKEPEEIMNLNGPLDRVTTWGTLPEGECNIKIVVQLATGERPTIYIGELIA